MQVRELIGMGHFLKSFIQEHNLPKLYKELINSVNEAAQNKNPENVRVQLKRLRDTHTEADNQILSAAQNKLLDDYGANRLLGKNAMDRVDRIFVEH